MKTLLKALWASTLFWFLYSCKKQEQQNLQVVVDASTSQDDLSKEMSNEAEVGYRSWIGRLLRREDKYLFPKWIEDLSRSPNEKHHREQQLAHMIRTEVLTWDISYQDLPPTRSSDEPKKIELPFFGDQTLTVIATKIHHYGEKSVNLRGYLASDPKSKIHLNLSNQSPTVLIEGPNILYYYESFEDVVILREDEPNSHHSHSHPHPHLHSHSHDEHHKAAE